jgi:hypothetical protein
LSCYIDSNKDGWLEHTDSAATASLCFNSLPEAEGLAIAEKLFGRHSAASFFDTLTYAGYHDVPVSWFFCEDDRCVTPQVQQVRHSIKYLRFFNLTH